MSYQGEVNETTDKRHLATSQGTKGRLVLRGANVCLYVLRDASQGESLYIDATSFRKDKMPNSKAFHGNQPRVGFQRSSPQNNFRRIVAAKIPAEEFCFDTISYILSNTFSRFSPEMLLALLNSKLLDWYFRLGSTNSKVNEYQFNNLPCPVFRDTRESADEALSEVIAELLESDPDSIPNALAGMWSVAPFSPCIREALEGLVRKISESESRRGEITRAQRANLGTKAQPYQDVIDFILFRLAGLEDHEIQGIESRLEQML